MPCLECSIALPEFACPPSNTHHRCHLHHLQALLQALSGVAQRHGVPIADVAVKWVLDKPQVRKHVCVCGLGGALTWHC